MAYRLDWSPEYLGWITIYRRNLPSMVRVSALPRLRCHIMTSSCLGFAERNRCTVTMASDCSVPFQPVRPDLTESLIATTVQMATGSTAATVTCTRLAPPTAGSSIAAAHQVALSGTTNITCVLASRAPARGSTDTTLWIPS